MDESAEHIYESVKNVACGLDEFLAIRLSVMASDFTISKAGELLFAVAFIATLAYYSAKLIITVSVNKNICNRKQYFVY